MSSNNAGGPTGPGHSTHGGRATPIRLEPPTTARDQLSLFSGVPEGQLCLIDEDGVESPGSRLTRLDRLKITACLSVELITDPALRVSYCTGRSANGQPSV